MKLEGIIQTEVNQKEKHQYSILTHIYGIQKDGNNDPICETAKETQTVGLWEKARVGWFERIALKHVCYHMWNRSPVQVQCMKQGTQASVLGQLRGIGWGGRWESGSGQGDTCTPVADSCQCMAKPPNIVK